MDSRKRKMTAPIVVAIIMVVYFVLYFGLLLSLLEGAWKFILGIVPLALAAAMIWVCRERINEIKEGEEDDLGKY